MAKNDLTAERLRELLHYDPETGDFTWRVVKRSAHGATKIGAIAGHPGCNGYRLIGVDRGTYLAHRLAWLYMTGSWPADYMDHINRDRSCNKWANLRVVSHKQNHENRVARRDSSTGILGVYRMKNGRWTAKIKHNRHSYHLGCFDTIEAAAHARVTAAKQLFTHSPYCKLQSSCPDADDQSHGTG